MKVSILITALALYAVYNNGLIYATFHDLKSCIDYCNKAGYSFDFTWSD